MKFACDFAGLPDIPFLHLKGQIHTLCCGVNSHDMYSGYIVLGKINKRRLLCAD